MSLVRRTGKVKKLNCHVCGSHVQHEERISHRQKFWQSMKHKAPCGADCVGGGVDSENEDIHTPWFGKPCPRCGEVDSKIVKTILNEDETEKALYYKYTRSEEYRIELETMTDGTWKVFRRWPSNSETLEGTIDWSINYIKWLG